MREFVVITLGTGLGSGFVTNGALIYGADGMAGELGHVAALRKEGRSCGCGRKDCLETYVSATGLVTTAKNQLASGSSSILGTIPTAQLNAKIIANAAREGDRLAKDIFRETGEILGFALANTAAIVSPAAYFFTGGLAYAGDLLLEPAKTYMEHYIPTFFRNKIQLLISGLQDKNPAILGGAALIWNELSQ